MGPWYQSMAMVNAARRQNPRQSKAQRLTELREKVEAAITCVIQSLKGGGRAGKQASDYLRVMADVCDALEMPPAVAVGLQICAADKDLGIALPAGEELNICLADAINHPGVALGGDETIEDVAWHLETALVPFEHALGHKPKMLRDVYKALHASRLGYKRSTIVGFRVLTEASARYGGDVPAGGMTKHLGSAEALLAKDFSGLMWSSNLNPLWQAYPDESVWGDAPRLALRASLDRTIRSAASDKGNYEQARRELAEMFGLPTNVHWAATLQTELAALRGGHSSRR